MTEQSAADNARDSKAKLVRTLTPWTDKTELAVDTVAIARLALAVEAGVATELRLVERPKIPRVLKVPSLRSRRELPVRNVNT